MRAFVLPHVRPARRFFYYYVRIGASNAERTYARAPGLGSTPPFPQFRIHVKRSVPEIDLGIGLPKMQTRREQTMLHRQCSFDKAGNARSGIKVADVGFNRADGAKLFALGLQVESLGQRCYLNRVSKRRCSSVSLDVGDAIGGDSSPGLGPRNDLG